jgi:thiamine biosynthesis protein ThiI
MRTTLYLVRLGEISLKGLNRDFFEKKLKENIKAKLAGYKSQFTKQKGRFFIEIDENIDDKIVQEALATTFGVVSYAKAIRCAKNIDEIVEVAKLLSGEESFIKGTKTFKVETVRSDKGFELNSYELSSKLGSIILEEHPHLKVDVKKPDKILYLEIRDKAYLFTTDNRGPGGLPVGSAGRALTMLSGGIDSPVATYMMGKRGLKQEAVYFHAYPYTSDEAKEKVVTLAKILRRYLGPFTLHVVPFTDVQLHIKKYSYENENTLLMRACMVKIANEIAQKRACKAIVTGEALSQVASQTLESLAFTDSLSHLPVFRPLIGLDKQEIIQISRQIGTYETSILPYDDCCTIFSPKHPLVRPDKEKITASYYAMQIEALLLQAVEQTEMIIL